jgi:hypothetical protein
MFYVVMMCAFIFYFAYRSRLVFKFELDSKEFEKIKGFVQKKLFYSLMAMGQNPATPPARPSRPPPHPIA